MFFWNKLKIFCKILPLKTFIVNNHSSIECIRILHDLNCDHIFLSSSNYLLKHGFLKKLSCSIINCHPGLLPNYRSLDSNMWAIYDRKHPFVSSHYIDSGIDTGPLIFKMVIPLYKYDSILFLKLRYPLLRGICFVRTIELIHRRSVKIRVQNLSQGTHCYPMCIDKLKSVNHLLFNNNDCLRTRIKTIWKSFYPVLLAINSFISAIMKIGKIYIKDIQMKVLTETLYLNTYQNMA